MAWQSPISPGISWYEASIDDRPHYAPLDGSVTADVAIVGGGFTGLQAAYSLAKSGVNVRQGPNKNTTVLGTLSTGDAVEKVGQEGKWVEIKYQDGTAYVFEDYLESR